ncbi:hypothetical protein [Mycolicibacterium obuense]|uniref:hypothetical protein n=1 Tax=Mycolicibacterium obuense TaxID=1807 RepID=UPI0039B78A01
MLAEELMDAGCLICVIDPTGVWHGLRSSADGREPGFPVVILGRRPRRCRAAPRSGCSHRRTDCSPALRGCTGPLPDAYNGATCLRR